MPRTKMLTQPHWRAVALGPALPRSQNPGSLIFHCEGLDAARLAAINRALEWPESPQNLEEQRLARIEEIQSNISFSLLWVCKQQAKMLYPDVEDVIGKQAYKRWLELRDFGLFLNQLLETSYGVADALSSLGERPFEHAKLWSDCIQDIRSQAIMTVSSETGNGGKRAETKAELKQIDAQLKRGQNPWSQDETPHIYRLFEVGLMIAKSDAKFPNEIRQLKAIFKTTHWTPLLASLKRYHRWALQDKTWIYMDPQTSTYVSSKRGRQKIEHHKSRYLRTPNAE